MDYLGNMRMVVFTDEETFHLTDYGSAAIEKRSRFFTAQVDNAKPTWFDGRYRSNRVDDEIDYIQYGQSSEEVFYEFLMSDALPSSWLNWPTVQNPTAKYKYLSVEFNMSMDQKNWLRSTYSLLDWLGDLGGLLDALIHVARVLAAPMASFTL